MTGAGSIPRMARPWAAAVTSPARRGRWTTDVAAPCTRYRSAWLNDVGHDWRTLLILPWDAHPPRTAADAAVIRDVATLKQVFAISVNLPNQARRVEAIQIVVFGRFFNGAPSHADSRYPWQPLNCISRSLQELAVDYFIFIKSYL
jgi:hypothetical protein